jgi:hypothetical protein
LDSELLLQVRTADHFVEVFLIVFKIWVGHIAGREDTHLIELFVKSSVDCLASYLQEMHFLLFFFLITFFVVSIIEHSLKWVELSDDILYLGGSFDQFGPHFFSWHKGQVAGSPFT